MGKRGKDNNELMVWGDDVEEAFKVAQLNREIPQSMSLKAFRRLSLRNREYPKWNPYWSPFPNPNATSLSGPLIPKWLRRLVQKQRSGKAGAIK